MYRFYKDATDTTHETFTVSLTLCLVQDIERKRCRSHGPVFRRVRVQGRRGIQEPPSVTRACNRGNRSGLFYSEESKRPP